MTGTLSAADTVTRCKKCTELYLKSKSLTHPPVCKHFYANQRSKELSKEHAEEKRSIGSGSYQTFFDDIDGSILTKGSGRHFSLLKRRFARRKS